VRSISKTSVTREVAANVVLDAFGEGVSLLDMTELTHGWFNAAYVLTLSDERRCVLKVAPPRDVDVMSYEHNIMATEVAALKLIRAHTSAPVPQVLWYDETCARLPSPLFIMEHCSGELLETLRPSLNNEQQLIVDAQIAGFLRSMNALTNPTFGLQAPDAPRFSSWSEAFGWLVETALVDGEAKQVVLPCPYDRIRRFVGSQTNVLDEVTSPRFVHWDLWDSNIFVDPQTLKVVGLIDFERALWADPLMESQFFSKINDDRFLLAYGEPLWTSPEIQHRRLMYDLYLFVVMVVEVAYRQYPTEEIDRMGRHQLGLTLAKLGLLT
jgi:aminoglycoside phosphotransferase (APT) family kinase protein